MVIVMISITIWNVPMMVEIVVDPMSILIIAYIVSALREVAMEQLYLQ